MMDIEALLYLYSILIMLIFISFINIFDMNNKLRGKSCKKVKLKLMKFLFFKSDKNDDSLYNLKTVILQMMLYFLIVCTIAGFVISLNLNVTTSMIIFYILLACITTIGACAAPRGSNKK